MEESKKDLDSNVEKQVRVQTSLVKCDSCGSNLVFHPEKNQLYCEHCGYTKEIQNRTSAQELDLVGAFSRDEKWEEETVVFRCDNCGAKVVLSKNESAKDCPFCGTAHVQKTEELAGLKPNAVVPFAFGLDKALTFSKTWAKKGMFTSNKFKKNLDARNLQGVYTPCFTFDSYTTSTYVGRIGKTHTRVVGTGKNRRTETYVVWRNISGTYLSNFDDILITAGSKFDQKKLDKLSPYYTGGSVSYKEDYLLGYMAYHYDAEITDCWDTAKGIIDSALRKQILSQYSYDRVDYLSVNTSHDRVTYKYVMLPVYMGNFHFKKKTYSFQINGATGKVIGKKPKSAIKLTSFITAIVAVVGVIGFLIYKYLLG